MISFVLLKRSCQDEYNDTKKIINGDLNMLYLPLKDGE